MFQINLLEVFKKYLKLINMEPKYTYEQLSTLALQLQGLVNTLNEELYKLRAENSILLEKIQTISKIIRE